MGRGISGTQAARLIGVHQSTFSRASRRALEDGVDLRADDGTGWDPDKVIAWAGRDRDNLLSRAEAAAMLGVSREAVRRLAPGEQPRRPGARARYRREDVERAVTPTVGSTDGHGRYGVLDVDEAGVLCHECGGRWRHLGVHVWAAHGVRAAEYRAAHGLSPSTALAVPGVREAHRVAGVAHADLAREHLPRPGEVGGGRRGRLAPESRARRYG